jgi:hypothetical protein
LLQKAFLFSSVLVSSLSSIFSAGSGLIWLYLLNFCHFLCLGFDVFLRIIILNFESGGKFQSLPESPTDEEFISLLMRLSDDIEHF